jgi:hypothetical protein
MKAVRGQGILIANDRLAGILEQNCHLDFPNKNTELLERLSLCLIPAFFLFAP